MPFELARVQPKVLAGQLPSQVVMLSRVGACQMQQWYLAGLLVPTPQGGLFAWQVVAHCSPQVAVWLSVQPMLVQAALVGL